MSLATCLDRIVECQACLALNQAEALDRDCDWFDDGIANASCRNPSLGAQDSVVIISTFASSFVDYPWPQDRANAERYFFDDTDSLDAYVWEASYGKTWLRGEVYGFYELPLPYSSYCPSAGACLWHMLKTHAIAAADPDIDFTRIDRVLLVFGGMPFQFARSTRGTQRIRTQEGEITASVSWFDRATMGRSGARAHEMGHGFGARHAYGVSCGEHIIDVDEEYFLAPKLPSTVLELSQQGYFFGDRCSVINGADDENSMGGDPDLLRHYSAFQKERYGWLEREQVRVIDRTRPNTVVELEQYELPSDGIKAVKIPVFEGFQPGATPSAFFYYYLEYRREVGFDAGSKINGVLVRLAMHPDYPSDFDTLTFLPEPFVLEPGIDFEDFYNENLTVEVLAMSEASATVEITYH